MKEAGSEAELVTRAVTAARGTMERVASAWKTYNDCMTSLQTWLAQKMHSHGQNPLAETQVTALFKDFVHEKLKKIPLYMKSSILNMQ